MLLLNLINKPKYQIPVLPYFLNLAIITYYKKIYIFSNIVVFAGVDTSVCLEFSSSTELFLKFSVFLNSN